MSDNVGLSTPRGSGTSGYVQRNLAHFRPRDNGPYGRDKDFDSMRHTQRKPDQGILEHDRKREVEVKVFELRDKLEEEGYAPFPTSGLLVYTDAVFNRVPEEEIDTQCDELRKKLLAEMERNLKGPAGRHSSGNGAGGMRKNLKSYQVHEIAEAKIKESERLRQALKISKDYEEGSHWRRQEERLKKAMERDSNGPLEPPAGAPTGPARDRNRGRDRPRERERSRSRSRSRSVKRERTVSRERGDVDMGRERYRDRSRSRSRDRSISRSRSRSRSPERGSDRRGGFRRRSYSSEEDERRSASPRRDDRYRRDESDEYRRDDIDRRRDIRDDRRREYRDRR